MLQRSFTCSTLTWWQFYSVLISHISSVLLKREGRREKGRENSLHCQAFTLKSLKQITAGNRTKRATARALHMWIYHSLLQGQFPSQATELFTWNELNQSLYSQTRIKMLVYCSVGRFLMEQLWHCEFHLAILSFPSKEISHPACQLATEITSEDTGKRRGKTRALSPPATIHLLKSMLHTVLIFFIDCSLHWYPLMVYVSVPKR